jgi:long-chain fatty acid transport protein
VARGHVIARAGVALAVLLAVGRASSALGAGFAVLEKSPRALGTAYAGETAGAEDPTTIWGNPAGMTLLDGTQLSAAGFAILPSAEFHDRGSHVNPAVGSGRLHGGEGGDAGSLALLPTFFLTHAIGSRVRVGLGVFSPYGLVTSYDRGWIGRYHALSSSLYTVTVNPSLAVKVTDWLSVGGGADIEYAKARLTNSLDTGAICQIFGAQRGIGPAVCNALGLRPQAHDGFVRVSGDDWNAGYDAGLLFTPSARTRIGLSYRSRIHHDLGGEALFGIPKEAAILRKASGALVNTGGHAAIDLPERAGIGASHDLTPRWTFLADIVWTRWSRFDELVFRFDNPRQPRVVQPEGWDDSFRYALGLRYTPARRWAFRVGTAYDENPIPNPTLRTPRIPDSDRIWLALGVGVRPTDRLAIDVGYGHVFSPSVSIDNRDPVTGHRIVGRYDARADVVGVQLTWNVGWPPLGEPLER